MSVKLHGGNLLKRRTLRHLAVCVFCMVFATAAQAAVLGLVTDTAARHIAVFDADTDRVAAKLNATPGNAIGDCAVSPRQSLGISSNSASELAFIELGGLAPKQTALPISNLGVDMALSPDGDWLVAAGGGALAEPLSVIDTRSRTEVAISSPFMDHTSVEFCDDATLLVTTSWGRHMGGAMDNALYSAAIGDDGAVTLTGQRLAVAGQPNNSACAPGSAFGVLLDRDGGVTTFSLPDLAPVATGRLAGMGLSAAFNADGSRLYVRTAQGVEAFDFDPATGDLQRVWSQDAPTHSTWFGIEQLAVHPDGDKLYLDGGRDLLVMASADGALLRTIETADATGVCLAVVERPVEYLLPGGAMEGVAAP